ncbi:MAG: exodeoxyribonuclease VII small subunit, partial [Candidatus Omnitrophota bacterium]
MKEVSFEQALKQLEEIALNLEKEDVSLDAALKQYEESM